MEPTTSLITALAKKSGEAALDVAQDQAKGFLQKLMGPSAEAIGEALAIGHRERLFNNVVEALVRARKTLDEAGVSPKQVPLKIIHPLLEGTALDEEPPLRQAWANMLANAANPKCKFEVYPAFPHILKQLSAHDVQFLDCMYSELIGRMPSNTRSQEVFHVSELLKMAFVDFTEADFNAQKQVQEFRFMLSALQKHGLLDYELVTVNNKGGEQYSLSDFGIAFIAACRPLEVT